MINLQDKKNKITKIISILVMTLIVLNFIINEIFFAGMAERVGMSNIETKMYERERYIKEFFTLQEYSIKEFRNVSIIKDYLKTKEKNNQVEDLFKRYIKSKPKIVEVSYIDKSGIVQISMKRIEDKIDKNNKKVDYSKKYYFKNKESLEKIWWSELHRDDFGKEKIENVRLVLPIKGLDGQFDGEIVVTFRLNELLKDAVYTTLYDIYLLEKKSLDIIKHNEETYSWSKEKGIKYDLLKELDLTKEETKNRYFNNKKVAVLNLKLPTHQKIIMIMKMKDIHIENNGWLELKENIILSVITLIIGLILIRIVVKLYEEELLSKRELEKYNLQLEQEVKTQMEEIIEQELEKKQMEKVMLKQIKMAEMGEMIANIAHQWRQPLANISVNSSTLLLLKEKDEEKYELESEEMLEEILNQTKYLSETMDTFKNYLNMNKNIVNKRITTEISKAIDLTNTLTKQKVQIKYKENKKEDLSIELVENEITQVIMNLLNNSVDAYNENKIKKQTILIETKLKKEGCIQITVEDKAGGIPTEIIEDIFVPYFTTKHKSKGTGLGLYMSYKIITEGYNGRIYVENTKLGSKFIIELPTKRENNE